MKKKIINRGNNPWVAGQSRDVCVYVGRGFIVQRRVFNSQSRKAKQVGGVENKCVFFKLIFLRIAY